MAAGVYFAVKLLISCFVKSPINNAEDNNAGCRKIPFSGTSAELMEKVKLEVGTSLSPNTVA